MEGHKQQEKRQETSTGASRFVRVLKVFFAADAAMLLFLGLGFVVPSKPVHEPGTGALPENYYDYSAKMSPFTPPAPQPKTRKTDLFRITARGPNPTFVPVSGGVPGSYEPMSAYSSSDDGQPNHVLFPPAPERAEPSVATPVSASPHAPVEPVTDRDSS